MRRWMILAGLVVFFAACGTDSAPATDAGAQVEEPDAGTEQDAGETRADAGDGATGLVPPGSSACCDACAPGSSCQANGCYNGYYCDASRCRCVSPPTDGGTPGCTHACGAIGATSCSDGMLRTCQADSRGCRVWSSPVSCESGACANPTRCDICEHACPTLGATRCEDATLYTCGKDAEGCRTWDYTQGCWSGFCSEDQTGCGQCENECSWAGTTSCSAGQRRTCETDAHGCRYWSSPTACEEGFCSGNTCGTCNHACDTVGTTECDGGEVRTCEADSNGCRRWSAATACPSGFCADDQQCAACIPSCGTGCLWNSTSCMEVVHRETDEIGELTATSDGLFWNRDHGGHQSALVHLPAGGGEVQVLGTVPTAFMQLSAKEDVLYASAWSKAVGSFFMKPSGQPVVTASSAEGRSMLFAGFGVAFFADGVSIYTPYRHIYRRTLPTTCPTDCHLGPGWLHYSGDEAWPGSDLGDSDGESLFFVSVGYGNYPINDIKRGRCRIYKAPLAGGEATVVKELYDKEGPEDLVVIDGGIFYLLDGKVSRIDIATGAEQRLYTAPAYTNPWRLVTDGRDIFWIDQTGALARLREGATKPEVLARGMDLGIPYNLALTDEAVYVTGDNRRTVLRWTRP
jgi:hypothetical protein